MGAVLDLQMADRGRLQFTGEQPELIRAKLTGRHIDSPESPAARTAALMASE